MMSMVTLLNSAIHDGRGKWILNHEWRRTSKSDRADLLCAWFEKNENIHFRLAFHDDYLSKICNP